MKYPSGAIVTIDLGRVANYGADHRMEIHGSNGVCLQREAVYPTSVVSLGDSGELRENRYADHYTLWRDCFEAELDQFVNALQGKSENVVTAKECKNIHKVIAACNESLKTGQPVKL
ncbi:uncharacterized oxidoreductase YrbE-like [Amphiura filiformis]|uniref:uncharacterized oxidoreductase YrbE-like n=1 Tax=Amphiura filiformis TaxID=82378 RepID=UPI003B21CCE3